MQFVTNTPTTHTPVHESITHTHTRVLDLSESTSKQANKKQNE